MLPSDDRSVWRASFLQFSGAGGGRLLAGQRSTNAQESMCCPQRCQGGIVRAGRDHDDGPRLRPGRLEVVASGLVSPRHLTFSPNGKFYVVEAGSGGTSPASRIQTSASSVSGSAAE